MCVFCIDSLALNAFNISSVWFLHGVGSITVVFPFMNIPASNIPDFACALAIGNVYVIGFNEFSAVIVSGGQVSLFLL